MVMMIVSAISSASPEPRLTRPSDVKFHIGQVIRHKRWKYRGVIIGWDPKARVRTNTSLSHAGLCWL